MRLGSHLSIAKGLNKAAEDAKTIDAETFQYFTRNPRGGKARQISAKEIESWKEARKVDDIYPIMGHLPYTVNLAAVDPKQMDFAKMVVNDDLRRINLVGGELLVSHPGRHHGDREAALRRLIELLRPALEEFEQETPVFCLETMALQGKELGSIDDLAVILKELAGLNVGVCLDTAHLFGAGWELRTKEGCDRLVDALEKKIGLDKIKCMHLNDSRVTMGSFKDRHANIGNGEIGYEGISLVVNHTFLGKLPMVLETPADNFRDYEPEIAMVRSMLS